jgi:Na+-translocating ferredoxin:NAD+ oxidoreductase subunit A
VTDLFVILLGTVLVNNFVLVRFLGLCPVLGTTRSTETALGMSLATTLVLTLSAGASHLIYKYLLTPLAVTELRLLCFILVIAGTVQFLELLIRRASPILHQALGLYLPLITTNCAVLGVALLVTQQSSSFISAVTYGAGAGLGFCLVMILFAGLRERLEAADVPAPFRGSAIALVTAGMMSLAFTGFSGIVRG